MLKNLFISLFLFSFIGIACEERDDGMPPPDDGQPPLEDPQAQEPGGMEQEPGLGQEMDADVADDELEEFATVILKAERDQIDPQMDPEGFTEVIEDSELDTDRFEEINFAVQQDPELQQELQQLFAELQEDIY